MKTEDIKLILEIASLLSAPVIAICAIIALRQIKTGIAQLAATEGATRTQCERESAKIAAEQTKVFAEDVIPLIAQFGELKAAGKYPILSSIEVTEDLPEIHCKVNDGAGLTKEIYSHGGLIVNILNRMESVAMFLTCGVGDADKAYRPLSSIFCEHVRHFLPYVVVQNRNHKQFTYTLTIFGAWALKARKEKIESEMKTNETELAKVRVPEIKTIGVKA